MNYKRKLAVLSLLASILAVIYILSFIIDPARQEEKVFAWLDARDDSLVSRIDVTGMYGTVILIRSNDEWFLYTESQNYPVRQQRVKDLLYELSRRAAHSPRGNSGVARETFGLSPDTASRIVVRGGAGLPLLDLFIGNSGALGSEVYMARSDDRKIFSAVDRFSRYTDSDPRAWLDLRLLQSRNVSSAMIQQVEIMLPSDFYSAPYSFRRSGNGWIVVGNENVSLNNPLVESWLEFLLEARAEDFEHEAPFIVEGSFTLYSGDGTNVRIQIGESDEHGARLALVSDTPFVYVLSPWTFERILREIDYFKL